MEPSDASLEPCGLVYAIGLNDRAIDLRAILTTCRFSYGKKEERRAKKGGFLSLVGWLVVEIGREGAWPESGDPASPFNTHRKGTD